MGLDFTRYVFGVESYTVNADIAYSVTDGVDSRGGSYVAYVNTPLEAWAFDALCNCPNYNPNTTTPPLPPVYPILFNSDVVYGREHFESNLKMFRADTYSRYFLIIQDGQYYNLTGSSARMTFKFSLEDSDADAFLVLTSPSDGITYTSPTTGELRFLITPSQTVSLPSFPVELCYDLQITDINSNVYTVSWGKLLVIPDSSITSP